jgi:hypothetical protein
LGVPFFAPSGLPLWQKGRKGAVLPWPIVQWDGLIYHPGK